MEADLHQCVEAPTMWADSKQTLALVIHVDGMILTGTEDAMAKLLDKLKEKCKVSIDFWPQGFFLEETD